MTLENLQKSHAHYSKLARGEFNERDFDRTSGTNESENEVGVTIQGKMTPQRRDLIKSNAIKHKAELERKHPQFKEKVEQAKPVEKEETKSKEKK